MITASNVINPHHGPGLDKIACAIFFACSPGTPSCALCTAYIILSLFTLFMSFSALIMLLERLPNMKVVCDPAFQVAIFDFIISAALCAGAWLSARQKLDKSQGWIFFHLVYASSLGASIFALLTARALYRVIVGNTREKNRFLVAGCTQHNRGGPKNELDPNEVGDQEDSSDEEIDHDERDRSFISSSYFSSWNSFQQRDYGLVSLFVIYAIWVLIFCLYGAVYGFLYFTNHKRSSQIAVYGATLGLTIILATGIFIYLRSVVKIVFATYPKRPARRLIRGTFFLITAFAFRAALSCSTLFLSMFESILQRCDKKRSHWPWSRICSQVLFVLCSLVDAVAILMNSRHRYGNFGGHKGSSFSAAIAPLALIQLDENALDTAPILGSGTFGLVKKLKLVSRTKNFIFVAVKCPKYLLSDTMESPWLQEELESFRVEAYAVAALDHHLNICRVLGIAESISRGPCLICEYMDLGSLEHVLNDQDDESNILSSIPFAARICALHVARAMAFLHGKGMIHLDLKPANILATSQHSLIFKVSDFGTARVLIDVNDKNRRRRSKDNRNIHSSPMLESFRVGTFGYMAPELLVDDDSDTAPYYNAKVDCFSFGICIWNLAANRNIWWKDLASNALAFLHAVKNDGLRPMIEPHFDPILSALMTRCWAHRPQDRPHFISLIPELEAALPPSFIDDDDHGNFTPSSFFSLLSWYR
uniref:non-specific serine/threonine protein kinase n=1 Tax=Aureoumbra lagunensis TaxID=44058 RepID=A0A7S3NJ66_9STRA